MSKKKIVVLALMLFGLFFIGVQTSNKVGLNDTAQASAKKSKLIPYVIPKRFRGTWHANKGKGYIRFTKRRVSYSKNSHGRLTYDIKSKNVPAKAHIWLIQKSGKEIVVCIPYGDGMGYRRQGKYLVETGIGYKEYYHR